MLDRLIKRCFAAVLAWPKLFVLLSVLLIIVAASQLKTIKKDASANAYMPPAHPALLYRETVKQTFGLDDPLVIAIINEQENGIFNPNTLELIRWWSEALLEVPNIDPDKITSLTTVKNIKSTVDGLDVNPFLPLDQVLDQATIDDIQLDIQASPLYQGTLVSKDGKGVLIVAELIDGKDAPQTYKALLDLKAKAKVNHEQIYIAGEGAVRGYLQEYMSQDARKMIPLAMIFILIVLFFVFRTLRSVAIPAIVIVGTLLTTIGLMASQGIPFYVITNALPVILIGIAVADSMHIFGEYYQQLAERPGGSAKTLVMDTMMNMWRPITLTTLTSIAGFIGIYATEQMPPMAYFGLYAAIGIAMAWLYSLVFLPAVLSLLPAKPSKLIKPINVQEADHKESGAVFHLSKAGLAIYRNSAAVIALSVLIFAAGIYSASQLAVDEERITSFRTYEPLYIADSKINQFFDGTNTLDIVVKTRDEEGLYDGETLAKIDALQQYIETLPGVGGTISIVEYIKQINKALNEDQTEFYRLPDDNDLIAQYFLLYSASGDPDDFERYIDYNYQMSNVRVSLQSGRYTTNKPVVEAIQAYIDEHFVGDGIQVNMSGRVNVDYHWIQLLGDSHFNSVMIALMLVLAVATLVFRSMAAGLIAILPVVFSVLVIYSIMATFDVWLGIGTSMFAAIAIGLGVDFSIHTLERFIVLVNDKKMSMTQAVMKFYPSTGRILLFNFLAVGLGFGLLVMSHVIPLVRFGALIAISIAVAFLASMTLIPTLLKVFKPKFLDRSAFDVSDEDDNQDPSQNSLSSATLLVTVVTVTGLVAASLMPAESFAATPDANKIIQQLNDADDGQQLSQNMDMKLQDRRGKARERKTKMLRKYYGEDKKLRITYESPKSVKGTGFLIFDYAEKDKDDDQWLYLPALKKARRISSSDRGKYFLGTDFTYDDIKNGGKVEQSDFNFTLVGETVVDGRKAWEINCLPKDKTIARELGYSKVVRWIDSELMVILKSKHWDIAGNELKTIESKQYEQVNGIWTAHLAVVSNHKTGHTTELMFSGVDYEMDIDDAQFSKRKMKNAK